MITIANAQIYSTAGRMAYQAEYSEGTIVRVIVKAGGWIQNEYKTKSGEWKLSGKAYIVNKNKKRQGERLIEEIEQFVK